jgi:hypothetical protein
MTRLLLLAALVAGCCHPDRMRPDPTPISDPWKPVVDWYAQRAPDSTACPPESLIGSLVAGSMDLEYGWATCRLRLTEAQGIAGIDGQVAAGRLQAAQDEADRMRGMRWTFGAVGIAIGAMTAGLLVGLAR